VHRLTLQEARRIAVRAQLLDAVEPIELVELVEHLGLLQLDPVSAIAPSADLVAWSRLGAGYDAGLLTRAVEVDRTLTELIAEIRSTRQLPIYLGFTAWGASSGAQRWLTVNDSFRRDVLARLEADGPLQERRPSHSLPSPG